MTRQHPEARTYWQGIKSTLKQRGLLTQYRKTEDGERELILPAAWYLTLEDRIAFVLDMQRLGGVAREKWLDPALWQQIRATLQGRPVFVADSAGLAVVVGRKPLAPQQKRLPRRVLLDQESLPDGRYTALLGASKAGDVALNLAAGERAMLIGGATGKGKTTAILSILLQLIHKNGPDTLRLAIVDLKRLDFTPFGHLPHLVKPIATGEPDAVELVAWARAEMERRLDVMSARAVTCWDRMDQPFPLLLIVVDECADFARSAVMKDLVELARKSRAAGIALILATQRPDKAVLNRQVKANLETRIAFAVTDRFESDVILDRYGAETLRQVGRCLTNAGGQWRKVQAAYAPEAALGEWLDLPAGGPVLDEIERALVAYAIEALDGRFVTDRLYDAQEAGRLATDERLSKYAIKRLAQQWERRGWLTEPARDDNGHKVGRLVTPELAEMATEHHSTTHSTPQEAIERHTIHNTTARNEPPQAGGGELPPFLAERYAQTR